MPQTVRELGGEDNISWVFSAYLASLAVTGPVWGNLADRWGSRATYLTCVAIFIVGSTWAAAAHSMGQLVAARTLQGVGGGGLTPLGQTVMSQIYDKEERASVQGWLVSTFALASLFGPVLGGYIAEHASWRWVFLLNLPFGAFGAVLLLAFFPRPQNLPVPSPFDWLGALGFVGWMGTVLMWADLLKSPTGLWTAWPWLLLAGVIALALRAWFRSRKEPFLPVVLLRVGVFKGASGLALLLGAGLFGAVTYFPLFLQRNFHLSSSEAGAAMLPLLLTWTVSAAVAPRQALRLGYGPVVGGASVALLVAYSALTWSLASPAVVLAQVALGFAGGLSFSPLTLAVQDAVPREHLGKATAGIGFLRTLGATLGTALMGALLEARGFRSMWALGLVFACAGLLAWLPFRRSLSPHSPA
jgi:EmrB/QacA subfamily drug resistance transporter